MVRLALTCVWDLCLSRTMPLTLVINFTHHWLQAVLLPSLINGSSIQGDGISFLVLMAEGRSASPAVGPLSQNSVTPTEPLKKHGDLQSLHLTQEPYLILAPPQRPRTQPDFITFALYKY